MSYHPVTEQITKLLSDHGIWFETFEHEPVRTSEEAAQVRHGYGLSQGAKALIVKLRRHDFKPNQPKESAERNPAPKVETGQTQLIDEDLRLSGAWVKVKKTDGESFAMLVVPGDKRFDRKKSKEVLNARDISFATEEEVSKITGGVQVGGVPPFGNLFGLEVVVDPSIFSNERIIFNAGDRRFSIGMKSEDYRRIVNPIVQSVI